MVIRVESSYHSKAFHWDSWSEIPISSAIEMFFLFFTSSLMNYIINQTSQFALESMGGEKFAKWTEVTVEELQAYTGFMTLMGLVKLPSIYDYWQRDEIYHYSPVASRITRDHYSLIASRITRDCFFSCTSFLTLLTTAHLLLQVLLSITNLGRYNPSSTV